MGADNTFEEEKFFTPEQIEKGFKIYNKKFKEMPDKFVELEGNPEIDGKDQALFLIMCMEKTDKQIESYLQSK